MITGIVTGALYATIQHGFYDNRKLMLVEITDEEGVRTGESLVAVDVVGAGPGEPVLVIDEGNSARRSSDRRMPRCARSSSVSWMPLTG